MFVLWRQMAGKKLYLGTKSYGSLPTGHLAKTAFSSKKEKKTLLILASVYQTVTFIL